MTTLVYILRRFARRQAIDQQPSLTRGTPLLSVPNSRTATYFLPAFYILYHYLLFLATMQQPTNVEASRTIPLMRRKSDNSHHVT